MPSINVNFNDKEVLGQALKDDEVVIGRQQDCTVHIDNLGISRKHAKLCKSPTGYTLHDLGSANGTFINGQRLASPTELKNGDQIQIGKYTIVYNSESTISTQKTQLQVMPVGGIESDVMSTMAMDSNKLKEQMEQIKKEKAAAQGQPVNTPPPAQPATAIDNEALAELRAKEAELELSGKNQRVIIIVLVVVIIIVIAAVAILLGGK